MIRKLILALILSSFVCCVSAQEKRSDKYKPQWVKHTPKAVNATYTYKIQTTYCTNIKDGRVATFLDVLRNAGYSDGPIAKMKANPQIMNKVADGTIADESYSINDSLSLEFNKIRMYYKQIDEYWEYENGTYVLKTLYATSTSKNTPPQFATERFTQKYGISGFWRSLIIPGWGQFHKGAYGKGGLMLGGTAVLVGGIIFTEGQRADYAKRMKQTHDINSIRAYQTKQDNFATARNICIGAAGALYIYNLIDAIAAPGAKRMIIKNNKAQYAFTPTVSPEGIPMMTASLTF